MSRLARVTATYAFCHFVVDLACIATVTGLVRPTLAACGAQAPVLAILTYDLVAFCLQLPVGALLDAWGRRNARRAALGSFALVAAGVSCGWAGGVTASVAAVILVAVGNALFHCVGGIEVLGESDGRAAPSGEFISTGALGVFLGGMAGLQGWVGTPPLLMALLVASAAAVLTAPASDAPGGLWFALSGREWVAVALLAATVALRSYTGMVMAFPWKTELALAALAIGAVVAGKALGGCVADALGSPRASALSLGGAALLFLPSFSHVVPGLLATFLFNFTMAITLSALARLFPQAQGLAFGIASFSLAVGALPALLGLRAASGGALALLSLVSLVLLELGLALMGAGRPARAEVRVRPKRQGPRP